MSDLLDFVPRLVPLLALAMLAVWCWGALPWNYSTDDAEPEVLNIAWRLAHGEAIYRSAETPPYAFAAYPPVYYVLVGTLLKYIGLSFTPARLVSLGASIAIGLAILHLHRQWNGRWAGSWPAFFLAIVPATLFNTARCHPEMLAVAFATWSLVAFLRNRPLAALLLSPLLNAAAFYTKQTYIALPVAAAFYLTIRHRRWLLPYLLATAITLGVPFLLLQWSTDGKFALDAIEMAKLPYNVSVIPWEIYKVLGPTFFLLGLVLVQLWMRLRKREWELLDIYTLLVLGGTLVSLGRAGAATQYVIALVVVCLLYALRNCDLPSPQLCRLVLQIQLLFLLLYTPWHFLSRSVADALKERRSAAEISTMLAASSGPVLSQQGSLPLFSRGYVAIQLFHFTNLTRMGKWDPQPLFNDIRQRKFCYAITKFPLEEGATGDSARERFTPELVGCLVQNYERTAVLPPYYVYRPRY